MKKRIRGLLSLWLAAAMVCSMVAVPAAAAPSEGTVLYTGFETLEAGRTVYEQNHKDVTFQPDTSLKAMTGLDGWKAQALEGWKCWTGTWDSGNQVKNIALMENGDQSTNAEASMTEEVYNAIAANYLLLEPVVRPYLKGRVSVDEQYYSDYMGIILNMKLNQQTEIMKHVNDNTTDPNSVLAGWKLWDTDSGNPRVVWSSETPEGEIPNDNIAASLDPGQILLEAVFGPKYRFTQQPTADNDYTVAVNEPGEVQGYAWYPVQVYEVVDTVTDDQSQIAVVEDEHAAGTYAEGVWTAYEDDLFVLCQTISLQAGDILTIATGEEIDETQWTDGDDNGLLTKTDTGYSFTADKNISDFSFGLMSETQTFTATIILIRTGQTPVDGQGSETFTGTEDGTYVCKAAFPENVTITSDPVAYTYTAPAAHSHDMSVECGDTAPLDFVPLGNLTELTSGHYYLEADKALNGSLTVQAGATVDLCLNGHELKYVGGGTSVSVISVAAGGALNLCDCNGSGGSHTITSPVTNESVSITGGLITGGNQNDGGGITCKGALTIYGGTVAGNTANSGGGVYVGNRGGDGASLLLHGGAICHNTAESGGGVYIYPGSTQDAVFTMTGGEIHHNRADGGGGVRFGGTRVAFTMTGGTIRDNQADYYGGVYATNHKITLTGGSITGNTADLLTGGIRMGNGSGDECTLGGAMNITGNTANGRPSNMAHIQAPITVQADFTGRAGVSLNHANKLGQPILQPAAGLDSLEEYLGRLAPDVKGQYLGLLGGEHAGKLALTRIAITAHPTAENPDVAVNYAPQGIAYQWHKAEQGTETVTDSLAAPYVDANNGTAATYAEGKWTASRSSFEHTGYFTIYLTEGDVITVTLDGEAPSQGNLMLKDSANNSNVSVSFVAGITQYTLTAPADGVYDLEVAGSAAPDLAASVTHTISMEALPGQTGPALSDAQSGVYACKITWPDGTVLVSKPVTIAGKTPLTEDQMTLSIEGWTYGETANTPIGSVTVTDSNGVISYQYSADNGTSWADSLPLSTADAVKAGDYLVQMSYEGDDYIGTKTAAFTVSKKAVTLEVGTLAASKPYDGTTAAALTGAPALIGVLEGDTVTATGGSGTYAAADAGTNIAVTVTSFTLDGADAGNYTTTGTVSGLTGTITPMDGTTAPGYAAALAQLQNVHIVTNVTPTLETVTLPAGWAFTGDKTARITASNHNSGKQSFPVQYTPENTNYAPVTLSGGNALFPVSAVALDVDGGLGMRTINEIGHTLTLSPVTLKVTGAALPETGHYAISNMEWSSSVERIATVEGAVSSSEMSATITAKDKGVTMVGVAYKNGGGMLGYVLVQVVGDRTDSANTVEDITTITETLGKLIDPENPSVTDKAAVDAVAEEVTKLPDAAKQALTVDDVRALDELKQAVGENVPNGDKLNITIDKDAEGQVPVPENVSVVGAAIACGVDRGDVVVTVKPVQPTGSDTKLELQLKLTVNNNEAELAAPMFFQMDVPEGIDLENLKLYHVKDDGSKTELSFERTPGSRTISFKMMSFSSVQFVVSTGGTSGGTTGGGGTTTYTLTATAGEGGKITPSGKTRVSRNSDKTFAITPDAGYEVADVLVDGESVGAVKTYTFETVRKDHTIAASFRAEGERPAWNPFTDVKSGDWYYDSVKYVYERGLMNGTGSTTFSPGLSTSRGMIVTMLWRLEQEPKSGAAMTFGDVKAGGYYYEAIRWGLEHEIVKGYTATTFGPDNTITRQELAAILYRYAQYKGADLSATGNLTAFTDRPGPWAEDSVKWAVGAGILAGKGNGVLDPRGHATRAEAAAMLTRFLQDNL